MIYEMKLVENEFNNVKYRGKIIEVRINDEKRKKIGAGDRIIFYKLTDMEESIIVNVDQVFKFCSFLEVYQNFPVSYFGYINTSIKEMMKNIYKIYTKDEEKEKGVVAIKFTVEKS